MSKHSAVIRVWTSCGAYWAFIASATVFKERASILRGKPTATSLHALSCCASIVLETQGAVEIVQSCSWMAEIGC
eukprot:3810690-Pyramimonas_sp.AAC.1